MSNLKSTPKPKTKTVRPIKLFETDWFESLKTTCVEFLDISSIHGLKYVNYRDGHIFIKLIWIVIVIASFLCCNYLILAIWFNYKNTPTKMIVASNHVPLPSLLIPAITFCHINRINVVRVHQLIDMITLPQNVTHDMMIRSIYQTPGFVDNIFYNESDLELLQTVLTDNRFGVRETMDFLQQPCNELFVKCRWEGRFYPCGELFKSSLAYHGSCCSFNIQSEHPYAKYINIKGGLSLVLAPQMDSTKTSLYSEGIKLLVHESNVFPSDLSFEKMISHRTETLVRLSTIATTCSSDVQRLPIQDRECLYDSEQKLRFFDKYREINCDLECRMLKILDLCKCLPYYFETIERIPVCNFRQIKCLVDHYGDIHESRDDQVRECTCISGCNDIYFDATTNKMQIYFHNYSTDSLYEGLNNDHMIVHIIFGKQVFRRLEKALMTDILALAANLGGLYSLFVGFSALTGFEIIHHYTVRFYANYQKIVAERRQIVSPSMNVAPRRQYRQYAGATAAANIFPSKTVSHE